MKPPGLWIGIALASAGGILWTGSDAARGAPPAGQPTSTGKPVPGMEALDRAMQESMAKWNLPGGQLAVAKDGRLVFNRAYGWADRDRKLAMQPTTLVRIASCSKPITGVAILKLVQQGKLKLDDRAFDRLGGLPPRAGERTDPRLNRVTVRQLLQHSGGFDPAVSGDPQFLTREELGKNHIDLPPQAEALIRWRIARPLDFDPGTRYAYSNFGYNVLGRVIEAVGGKSYEQFVQSEVLRPVGARDMRIGGSLLKQQLSGESRYYDQPGAGTFDSVFPEPAKVPQAYGSWNQQALDAHGGWLASAADLCRFADGIEGHAGQPGLLAPATIEQMEAGVSLPGAPPGRLAGLGWVIVPGKDGGRPDWEHAGALENCCASVVRRGADGVTYAATFNSLPKDFPTFFNELMGQLSKAISDVKKWPPPGSPRRRSR